MKKLSQLVLGLGVFAVVGCAPQMAAYRIDPAPVVAAAAPKVVVSMLDDVRPPEDKSGAGAGFMNKSTKDALYGEKVAVGITAALVDELRARGINASMSGNAPLRITGSIKAYRAMLIPPRTGFIPYISYVTWLWTNDKISVGINLDLALNGPSGMLLNKPYSLSQNTEEWVGLAGLASTARSLDNEMLVKVLHAGLKNVLAGAADELSRAIKNQK